MSDLPELPPELRALISSEQEAPAGRDADRQLIGARIATTLGLTSALGGTAAGATVTAATTSTGAAATATAAGVVTKIVIVTVAIGAAIGAGHVLTRRGSSATVTPNRSAQTNVAPRPAVTSNEVRPDPSPHAATTPAGPERARMATAIGSEPAIRTAVTPPPSPAIRTAVTPAPPPAIASDPLSDQRALLALATSAFARGEAAAALEIVDRDRSMPVAGDLSEEREALKIAAFLRLGRYDDARAVAQLFTTRYPGSVHQDIVDRAIHSPVGHP